KAALRHDTDPQLQVQLDLRYVGQEFTLPVPVDRAWLERNDRKAIRTAFDQLYDQRYAHHSPDEPVEMVNVRLGIVGKRPALRFPNLPAAGPARAIGRRAVYFTSTSKPVAVKVYHRRDLGVGAQIAGPALIQEYGTTTVMFENDHCRVARAGELIIAVG